MKFNIPKLWFLKKAKAETGQNIEAGTSPSVPASFHINDVVQPGQNLLVNRRVDGSWGMSINVSNIRLRVPPVRASGETFLDALWNLGKQLKHRP